MSGSMLSFELHAAQITIVHINIGVKYLLSQDSSDILAHKINVDVDVRLNMHTHTNTLSVVLNTTEIAVLLMRTIVGSLCCYENIYCVRSHVCFNTVCEQFTHIIQNIPVSIKFERRINICTSCALSVSFELPNSIQQFLSISLNENCIVSTKVNKR